MRRHRSGFGLFGFYALTSLIPIVILGVVLAQSFRHDLEQRGLEQGVAVANSVARSAIDPTLSGDSLADGPTPTERLKILASATPLLESGQALQLRVRDTTGRVIFDPTHPRQPPTGGPDHEVVEAIHDAPVRLLTRINADEVDRFKPLGTRAIEVYTPIHSVPDSGHALGALEIYVPYAPIAASIDDSYRTIVTLLVVGLFALWCILATISWSVTARLRKSARTNRRLARTDSLTGLANRTAMAETVGRELASIVDGQTVTVIAMDLDGFSHINEVLGHENGDRYLRHVAEQVSDTVGPRDAVARIGGDEFGVVMPDAGERQVAQTVANIRRALLNEVELGGIALTSEVTIGMVHGYAGDDTGELMRQAALACRAAKRDRTLSLEYSPDLEAFDADRLTLMTELRHGITLDQLVLHYQPKVAAVDGRVVGVEALLRWQHPTRGLLAPGVFLPTAESTELITPLTDWVIEAACRQAVQWRNRGRAVPIAVNVSARCLRDSEFADRVLATLVRFGVSPDLLAIEVTETAVISDPVRAASTLRRLAARGMSISLDDFGVGYTSLGQLHQLPIDEIKIDREFVAPLVTDSDDGRNAAAVVRAIILLAHELDMTVIAEGAEDDATIAELTRLGCDLIQGYGIARPAPIEQIDRWLLARSASMTSSTTTAGGQLAGVRPRFS